MDSLQQPVMAGLRHTAGAPGSVEQTGHCHAGGQSCPEPISFRHPGRSAPGWQMRQPALNW
jgi:hypothetical protein